MEELKTAIDRSGIETFADWLAREMPPGTIISDPRWWAPRIYRAATRFAPPAAPNETDGKLL